MTRKQIKIAIMLGGNLGNVPETFHFAVHKLAEGGLREITLSGILRNPAVDCAPGTPDFYNAALTGFWSGTAHELLALTQATERAAGRPAIHGHNTSRTLDVDIILFGDERLSEQDLQIPHPRASQRQFVLQPLAEIAPELIFPDSKKSVKESLLELKKEFDQSSMM